MSVPASSVPAPWNYGSRGGGSSSEAADGPCVHVAPLAIVNMGPRSTMRYRYWMVVGTEGEIAERLDALWEKYSRELLELSGNQ